MIEYILTLIVLAAVALIVTSYTMRRSEGAQHISRDQTMVYKSDSNDVVAESYHPGIRGSVGPLPVGKKKERKKTETFENRERGT